jgi:hypothetical protein
MDEMNEFTRLRAHFLHLARIRGEMNRGEVTDIRALQGAIWPGTPCVGILTGR